MRIYKNICGLCGVSFISTKERGLCDEHEKEIKEDKIFMAKANEKGVFKCLKN